MEFALRRILHDVVDTIVFFWVGASPTWVKFLPRTGVYVQCVHWGETCSYLRFVGSCRYVQAERGFAKEASVYFPYLDFVLFCTVHYATLPFRYYAILPFRHSPIPPFCHFAISPFCHSAILPFGHSAILPFRSNMQLWNVCITGGAKKSGYATQRSTE